MVTIILPVSRRDYLKRVFQNLEELECDVKETNLLVYVDGNIQLFQDANDLTSKSKFNDRLCIYRRKGIPDVSSVRRRRQRIADIHNELKTIVGNCTYVLLLEDDTLLPTFALKDLLYTYSIYHTTTGFVSGVELGRWGFTHVGAWTTEDPSNPTTIKSIKVLNIVQRVDAAGFYCMLTRTDLYKRHDFQPFDTILGPDVQYGLQLSQRRYNNYVCGWIHCTHMTKKGDITVSGSSIITTQFIKTQSGKWELITHE